MIAMASALPAFFLGTTVSFYLSLPDCQCDHYHERNNNNNLPEPPLSSRRRGMGSTLEYPQQQQQQQQLPEQRPVQLPAWVEDVVQERLAEHVQKLHLQNDPNVAIGSKGDDAADSNDKEEEDEGGGEGEEDEEERPNVLPSWVEDVVLERLEEERKQFANQMAENNSNARFGACTRKLTLNQARVGNYITGMATTPKANFTSMLDLGVPLDPFRLGSTDVLMIYSNQNVLPAEVTSSQTPGLVQLSAEAAVEKCDYISVILTDHADNKRRNQCLAIVPQYESYHIQRWGRLNKKKNIVQKGFPLQLIPHGTKKKGIVEFQPPNEFQHRKMFDLLKLYLKNMNDVKAELKVILERIAIDNTVIVMVCNFGQSELLINFVCSAHSRGFDLSNVIVFTTDQETDDLARGLGLTSYYDHRVRQQCHYTQAN